MDQAATRRGGLALGPEPILLAPPAVAQRLARRPNCGIFTNRHPRCSGYSHASGAAGKMARVTGEAEMAVEAFARSVTVLLLPILAFACIVADPGPMATLGVWLAWMVLALAIDAVSPRVGRTRDAAGSTTTALLFTAPLLQGAVLVYALWLVSATPKGPMSIAMIAVMVGISGGTVGISAAHELVHRRGSLERGIAQAFMLLVSYPHFPIVHLRVHHPYVGTPLDPGTSRLNEPLVHFVGRAFVLAWHSGWRVERSRLARKGLTPWRMDNAILRALALQAALYVALGTAFGWIGLALFAGQSAVAIFLALTIDYTQHYGVVRRETASGRLERLRADHAWTSDHASNRSTFNLGLHADHHLKPTQGYSQLVNDHGSLQAPLGYPGLLLLALVPSLWYRVMNTRLSANPRADAYATANLSGAPPPRR
jgi:alkane 1-monooxygenase